MVLHATQASDYGILKFTVNGQASTATFDGYSEQVQPGEAVKIGVFTPKDGKFVLRVEVSGFNPKTGGPRTQFGLDYLEILKPQ
ncbi:hypothetical protein EON80_10805 [bacterium]|nr:MAG: hypothetical protein EON80_10805 [bacterium]